MSITRYTLVFFAPKESTSGILDKLFEKFPRVVGSIGQYEQCAFVTRGTGQFKPGPEAKPLIGSSGQLEYVEEDRVELVVNDQGQKVELKDAIAELKRVHPYEEVAHFVHRLEDI